MTSQDPATLNSTVPIPIAFYCNPPWYAPRTVLRTDSRAGIPPAASSRVPPAP